MKKYTPPKKEFLMLLNSVFAIPLDVYAFQIYACLVCCAGSRGECWPTIHKGHSHRHAVTNKINALGTVG